MTATPTNFSTPGVYITELPAFSNAVVGVQTAIPVFIGYTETAQDPTSHKPLYLQPILISSLTDFMAMFGGAFRSMFQMAAADQGDYDLELTPGTADCSGTEYFKLIQPPDRAFLLLNAVRLFFANGGGQCYVTSCGPYGNGGPIRLADLQAGLEASGHQVGPTMVVMPDACQLNAADYATLVTATLAQCAALQDRVALLDLQGCMDSTTWSEADIPAQAEAFYQALGNGNPGSSYGAAYFPALKTSIVTAEEVDYTNLDIFTPGSATASLLAGALQIQAAGLYPPSSQPARHAQVLAAIAQLLPGSGIAVSPAPTPIDPATQPDEVAQLNQFLVSALPFFAQVEALMLERLNVAPASGPVAGLWAQNDQTQGVWNAPANLGLVSVTAPVIRLTDADQDPLNVPLNGYAINVLREFTGRGTLVWGARTLDGNSNDYRYIQVRRTLIYIERSIKSALQPFVFAANDASTWSTVTGMISNFLTGLWSQGGLMGSKASEAFTVQCGLGSTMTGQDVLDGYMVVAVTLQMVHPAEYIELTFKQAMQTG